MAHLKLLLCHTNGRMRGDSRRTFCRKGIYYPIVEESDRFFYITSEYSERHPITKTRYRNWFQLVEAERVYYELGRV